MRPIAYYIKKTAKAYATHTAVVHKTDLRTYTWTYAELYKYVCKIVTLLYDQSVQEGDKILLYASNSPHWLAAWLACAYSGVIAVPVDANSTPEFAATIAKKTRAKLAVSSVLRPVPKMKNLHIELLEESVRTIRPTRKTTTQLQSVLEIVYTSGTTGDPKGVQLTNENIVSNIHNLKQLMPLTANHTFLSLLPLSHVFEQIVGCLIPLSNGCTIIYSESRADMLELIKKYDVTTIVGVPLVLKTIRERIQQRAPLTSKFLLGLANHSPQAIQRAVTFPLRYSLGRSLEFFVVGGAPLSHRDEEFFDALGIPAVQGYGMTEAAPIITCNTLHERKKGSVGKSLPGQHVRVAADGEIQAKGKNITPGYYKNKKATNRLFTKDGWLRTGDIGSLEQSWLYITGRKKNMLLTSSGLNIYPEDIEAVLNTIVGVKESCVIQKEQSIIGTYLGTAQEKDVLKHANEMLNSHQRLDIVKKWHAHDYPRTTSLKIKRDRVAHDFTHNSSTPATDKVLLILQEVLGEKEIHETDALTNLGLDSLGRAQLIAKIEQQMNAYLQEQEITETTTVKQLRKLIEHAKIRRRKKLISWLNTPSASLLRSTVQLFTKPLTRYMSGLRTHGQLPTKPSLIVANHTSHLDAPCLIAVLSPTTAVAAAQEYFFGSFIKRLFVGLPVQLTLNAFAFSRDDDIRVSLKRVGKLLDEGFHVIIFPEGTRSQTGKLQRFKEGIGLLAVELNVPVIPTAISGAYEKLPKGSFFPRSGTVTIHFGKPLRFSKIDKYDVVTHQIEQAISSLNKKY